MSAMQCSEVREAAAELALGTLPGDERADAIVHLAQCSECQLRVEELSDAADSLLLLCPEADPPRSFARRVVAGMEPVSRPRWRRVAAVVTTGVLAAGLGIGMTTDVVRGGGGANPPFALDHPGVRKAQLVAIEGEHVQGQVFVDADKPSWVFMTVRDTGSDETYTCQLIAADGSAINVGSFQLHDGTGSWGRAIDMNAGALRTVRLVDSSGHTAAAASLA